MALPDFSTIGPLPSAAAPPSALPAPPAPDQLARAFSAALRQLSPAVRAGRQEPRPQQTWRESGGLWTTADPLPAAYHAGPPVFRPLPGETLSTPAFTPPPAIEGTGPVDVVIPLGTGSRHGDAELRYCLRSIERFLYDLGRVWIVGRLPDWIDPGQVIHLPVEDRCHIKDVNILDKLRAACLDTGREKPRLSDRFAFFSDDQLLLRPLGFQDLGPFHHGDLRARTRWPTAWWQRMKHTRDWLLGHRPPAASDRPLYHGDVHAPLPMLRHELLRVCRETPYRRPPGLCVGTLYLNHQLPATRHPLLLGDRKATVETPLPGAEIRRRLAGRWFLGHSDPGFTPELRSVLDEIFPGPSRFEREGSRPANHANDANETPHHSPDSRHSGAALPVRRNLIYHLYPFAGSEEWKLNVARLVRSWPLFTGRRIIGVVRDDRTAPLGQVQAAFPDDPAIEWLVQSNDPTRGETVTFLPAARMLRSLDPDEATFYAHAKGTSPKFAAPGQPELPAVRRWRDFMYRVCLFEDRVPAALDEVLRRFTAAGCLRFSKYVRQERGRPLARWHFAGTFFWLNHARFFRHPDALVLGPSRWALERHLGEMLRPQDACCLAADEIDPLRRPGIYRWPAATWDRLESEWEAAGRNDEG